MHPLSYIIIITLQSLLTAYSPMQQNAAQPARRWVITDADDNHDLDPYLRHGTITLQVWPVFAF